MLDSILCRHEHFHTEWMQHWAGRLHHKWPITLHRKLWEWIAAAQALHERGCLGPEKRGLGFAVGNEPLPALFASIGTTIEATDSLKGLFRPKLLDRESFDRLVTFHHADMNDLSGFDRGAYDFIWSSCAMEHTGSLESGLRFVRDSMDLLKPGGVAVHTTEFNLSSLTSTVEAGTVSSTAARTWSSWTSTCAENSVRSSRWTWRPGRTRKT